MVIYPTRYQARKMSLGSDVVCKVEGGYAVMSAFDYCIWRKQK